MHGSQGSDHLRRNYLKEHIAVLEKMSEVYSTGFFITVSPESITLASSHCNKKDETCCAPFIVEVPPFKEVLMKTMPSTDVFFGNETEAWKLVSSCFVVVPLLAPVPEPKTRSNTTNDIEINGILLHDVILSSTCPACPRILTTSQTNGRYDQYSSHLEILPASRTTMRTAATRLK